MRFFVCVSKSVVSSFGLFLCFVLVTAIAATTAAAQDTAPTPAAATPTPAAMPSASPEAAPRMTPPATDGPFVSDLKGVNVGMTKKEVEGVLGRARVSDDAGLYYSFSDTQSAQIGLDNEGKVRTIALIYSEGDKQAMSYTDVFGPGTPPTPDANGNVYKMMRYPSAGFWISYSLTNTADSPMTVITMRRIEAQ